MALSLRSVGHVYGAGTAYANRALTEVDLEVGSGQLVVVLGPSGSGKSTLLRIAAGLLSPTEGRVSVDDAETTATGAAGAGAVGLVFQRPESQMFAETVTEDVSFGPRNLGASVPVAVEAARAALESVGLDPDTFGPRSPFTLSGGEARRAALAGVFAMSPRYLLLDEPTAGLDVDGRRAVHRAVGAARARAGVVVVTHDPEEFMPGADTVMILSGGRSAFCGSPAGLLEDPTPLRAAGLAPPAVLEAQLLAREAGAALPFLTLDPTLAAESLAVALGGAR